MSFIGVLQTGDVDEAITVARKYLAEGRHILCDRVSFELTPELERQFMEGNPGQYQMAMNEHDPIEYEVYVEFPERRSG